MDKYKVSQNEIDSNNVKSAPTHNVNEEPRANKHIFDKLPELIAEKLNGFIDAVIGKLTEYYTKNETDRIIMERVTAIGAGDMQRAIYDEDEDGVVDIAKTLDGYGADYFAAKTAVEAAQLAAGAAKSDAAAAQTTANAAMPKSGGNFTGTVYAKDNADNQQRLRNIAVKNADGTWPNTNVIVCVRK